MSYLFADSGLPNKQDYDIFVDTCTCYSDLNVDGTLRIGGATNTPFQFNQENLAVNFQGPIAPTNTTVHCVKIGNFINISFAFTATGNGENIALSSSTPLPTIYRPSVLIQTQCAFKHYNGSSSTYICTYQPNGEFIISKDYALNSVDFGNGIGGLQSICSISFIKY